MNGTQVQYANTAKYIGMTLDAKLRWKESDELDVKRITFFFLNMLRKIYWLLGSNSELSIHNKPLLNKQVICPVWSYGIQLWGCTTDSKMNSSGLPRNIRGKN
jgi:hypothetical protein